MRKRLNYLKSFFFDPVTGFRRRHTPRRLINLSLNQLARRVFRSVWVPGYPIHASIEVNNTCDLRCPMCSSGQAYSTRRRGHMGLAAYQRIIDELAPYLYKVGPFNLGEPLLHPDIFAMIDYAQKKNVAVILSTNGNALDRAKAEKLVASGLEELVISLDAATEATYNRNRPGGSFGQVKRNIKQLMEIRREAGSRAPFVTINMILMENNVGEIEEFRKLAGELGVDKYNFSTYWEMYLGSSEKENLTKGLKPKAAEHRNVMPENMRVDSTCGWAWSGTIVSWNGNVIPCCFDYNETCVMGNVFRAKFSEIWNGPEYRGLRRAIKNGWQAPRLCRDCPRGF